MPTESKTHQHRWQDSKELIGLSGDLYCRIYPWACECGALMKPDHTILEPIKKGREEPK